jgi:hypothetical protein
MKKAPDYCHYLVFDDKKQENVCTCHNWLWFHCNDDCVRMGDIKREILKEKLFESDLKVVKRLEEILASMKNDLPGLLDKEKERTEQAIKRVEYDILRYKHEVPWLPKYRESVEEKHL